MQIYKKTRSRSSKPIKFSNKGSYNFNDICWNCFLLNKINFPTPNKVIEKIIPNENFKIVK